MSCSFPLPLINPPLPISISLHHHHHHCYSKICPFRFTKRTPLSSSSSSTLSKSHICFSSNSDQEEFLWLREEQRWLREEQRWLREEQRWVHERESLVKEIQSLKLQIEELQNRILMFQGGEDTVAETVAKVSALLQVLKEKNVNNLIAESGSSAKPIVWEEKVEFEEKGVIGVVSQGEKKAKKETKALRKGFEGEEVREMQEALLKLGFYSGEEDMEFSSFSSGTERAVKTWQASLGAPEDGIMTTELLNRLYMEHHIKGSISNVIADKKGSSVTLPSKEGANGAAVTSVTEISEIQQKVVKEEGITEVEASQQRVFLLGENRWEEPSRLNGRDKQVGGSKTKDSATKCLTCHGEGRLLCTECDGTGEPNVEPQFLEWVDEGAKCPYCEGLGYTICDVCEGKTAISVQ